MQLSSYVSVKRALIAAALRDGCGAVFGTGHAGGGVHSA